ncbi:MAG: PTS sugar transporter subunit IIB [Propionibacteriaceae bacterium]|jgi:PTS system ascorbate-specific IIB component|nr:PTS sugar transporter subunit IIB [Propionibacteriaceae bacterium]
MKFMAVCGSGLGSSFMVQLNIEKCLADLGISGVQVEHSDLSTAAPDAADVFFAGRDIAEAMRVGDARLVVLDSIIDMAELRAKVEQVAVELGLGQKR